jgi:EF hand
MKTTALLITLGLATMAGGAFAQAPGGDRPPGGPGGPRMKPPIMAALDADGDGTISAKEIENASAALKALDKNGDGQLTAEEIRPLPPEGGGPGGDRPKGDRPRGDRPQGDRPQGDRPQGDRPRGDRPRPDGAN